MVLLLDFNAQISRNRDGILAQVNLVKEKTTAMAPDCGNFVGITNSYNQYGVWL